MSITQRTMSLDRAMSNIEKRLHYTTNPTLVANYRTLLESMKARKQCLLESESSGDSLIEQALRGAFVTTPPKPKALFNNWAASAFRDAAFSIQEVPPDGDCLFHAVSVGSGYRVSQLKGIVASCATQEEFAIKKGMYHSAVEEHPKVNHRLTQTPRTSPYYEGLLERLARYADDISTYGWLQDINTLDEYRRVVAQRGIWGDAEAIGHLERVLNTKFLIFSVEETKQHNIPEIYQSTMIREGFSPSHYLLVGYEETAKHYSLIRHSGQVRFTFEQLPFSVRTLFLEKCPQLKEIPDWQ